LQKNQVVPGDLPKTMVSQRQVKDVKTKPNPKWSYWKQFGCTLALETINLNS